MQPIQLSVFSEIARLKQVVVHDPGPEVDLMVPGMMEKLLFDDILFGDHARQEHALFRQVLARVADEVLDVQDLFVEALADEGVKLAFIEDLRRLAGLPDETCNLLRDMPSAQAARSVITGVPWDDMPSHTPWEQEFDYRLRPIPNLLFMRDPASVIGDGYSVNAMATWAREREPLILSTIFRHHPRLRHLTDQDKWFDQVNPLIRGEIKAPVSLEGGDILVVSDKVLAVGCPFCKSMMTSTPEKQKRDDIVVKDVAELLLESVTRATGDDVVPTEPRENTLETAPVPVVANTQLPMHRTGEAPAAGPTATGTVVETMDASTYTYVRVKTATGDIWAAANQFKVAVGDQVVVPLNMPMQNFHSGTLKRTFPMIYFASHIDKVGGAAPKK